MTCEVRQVLRAALKHFRVKSFRSKVLNAFMDNESAKASTVADVLRWAVGDEDHSLESADVAVMEKAKAIAVSVYVFLLACCKNMRRQITTVRLA